MRGHMPVIHVGKLISLQTLLCGLFGAGQRGMLDLVFLPGYHDVFKIRRRDAMNVPIGIPFSVGSLRLEMLRGHYRLRMCAATW